MPTFKSFMGRWVPAEEEVGLINKSNEVIEYKGIKIQPGKPFVYKGLDREAVKALHEAGADYLGTDFRKDPEFLQAVRNMNFTSVDEYLKNIGFDEKKEQEEFEKRTKDFHAHEEPAPVSEKLVMGGGKDLSGNKTNDTVGGFGEARERKPEEVKK